MNTRRDFLKQTGYLTGTAASGWPAFNHGGKEAAGSYPNIIIILTDDQGYGDLGCFGAKGFATPNLDRMAVQGRRFSNFHVAQAVCSASRAGLLTGCYPNRIGIHGALGPKARHGLGPNEMTIAELVKQRGYATGMVGKWHLGHLPPFCLLVMDSINGSVCPTPMTCGPFIPRPSREPTHRSRFSKMRPWSIRTSPLRIRLNW